MGEDQPPKEVHTSKVHKKFKARMSREGITGFESEFSIGPFHVDEAQPLLKIVLEIDGCFWHGCKQCGMPGNPKTRKNDKRKDSYLKKAGWVLVRLPEHLVRRNPKEALSLIWNTLKEVRDARRKRETKDPASVSLGGSPNESRRSRHRRSRAVPNQECDATPYGGSPFDYLSDQGGDLGDDDERSLPVQDDGGQDFPDSIRRPAGRRPDRRGPRRRAQPNARER